MIQLCRPLLGPAEEAAVARVLRSGRLVAGPEVEAFEAELSRLCAVPHAVAASSGTAALSIALKALGIGPGDEVIVPALTFPAPAGAAISLGARAVVADVDSGTWNVSPREVERSIGPRTRAIVAVDLFGVPAQLDELERIAADAGIPLVEDAACSLGASLGGRPCGSFGVVAALSFHPRKVVTTGEGGAVLTHDPQIAQRAVALRDHGRLGGEFRQVGLNLRMGEVSAAIGRCQLERLEGIIEARARIARRYGELLRDRGRAGEPNGAVELQHAPPGARTVAQTLAVMLPPSPAELRDRMIADLSSLGIETQVASYSLPRLAPFAERLGIEPGQVPAADAVHRRGLALPIYPELGENDVARVVEALVQTLEARCGCAT